MVLVKRLKGVYNQVHLTLTYDPIYGEIMGSSKGKCKRDRHICNQKHRF